MFDGEVIRKRAGAKNLDAVVEKEESNRGIQQVVSMEQGVDEKLFEN